MGKRKAKPAAKPPAKKIKKPAVKPPAKNSAPPELVSKEPSLQSPPARPEIVVLSFSNSDLASEFEPISSEELMLLQKEPIAKWQNEIKIARSFAMQATNSALLS